MKFYKLYLLLAFIFLGASTPPQDNYILSDDYLVTIQGTSNLHNWEETVKKVSGKGSLSWNEDGSFNLNTILIKIDVFSIKSDNSTMDKKTYSALKAEKFPEISFSLSSPVKTIKVGSGENIIVAKGNLTIAGITKPVTIKVKATMVKQGLLLFQSSQTIKMSDYGVDAPTALFGTLKTGDQITLNFKTNFILNN